MSNTAVHKNRDEALEMLSEDAFAIAKRAQPVFEMHNWTYFSNGAPTVPDEYRLAGVILNLITAAKCRPDTNVTECGRFRLDIESYGEGDDLHYSASLTLHI